MAMAKTSGCTGHGSGPFLPNRLPENFPVSARGTTHDWMLIFFILADIEVTMPFWSMGNANVHEFLPWFALLFSSLDGTIHCVLHVTKAVAR